jgi:hypothetical protein
MSNGYPPVGFYPPIMITTIGTLTITTATVNSTTNTWGYIFEARQDATIDRVYFRYNSITGTPGVAISGFQSLDTSGNPSGTWLGATANGFHTFTPTSGDNTVWKSYTLNESVSLTKGQKLAWVFRGNSGNWNASNSITLGVSINVQTMFSCSSTWAPTRLSASTKSTMTSGTGCFAFGNSTNTYGWPLSSTRTTISINSGGTQDEVGTAFTLGTSGTGTYEVTGMFACLVNDSSITSGQLTLSIYNGTTSLQSTTIDVDYPARAASTSLGNMFFDFETPVTLNYGTEYIIAIKNNDTLAHTKLNIVDWGSIQYMNNLCPLNMSYKRRTGTGAWTTGTTGEHCQIWPIFSDFVGGSSGLIVHPGMAGGMRG